VHYDAALLPVDDRGGFVFTVHHGKYQVGGEDTRETGYAHFRAGHVDHPAALRDIAAVCTIPRKSSKSQAAHHQQMARGQGELARSGAYSKSSSEMYAQNETRYLHSARLALVDTVRVPRSVFASRAGRILLGFDPSLEATTGEGLPGISRIVDVKRAELICDRASARIPIEPKRKGLERYSSVQLGRPVGLSLDGTLILISPDPGGKAGTLVCSFDTGLEQAGVLEVANFMAGTHVLATRQGWISLGDESIRVHDLMGKHTGDAAVPRGAIAWASSVSLNSEWIAMPADGGAVWVVGRFGGRPRRFNPHRGLRRDDWVKVAISECGRWLASWARSECVVTRLEDGVSWPVGKVEDRVHEDVDGDYVVRSSIPAVAAFIGSQLLVAQDGAVRKVAIEEGEGAFVSEQGKPGARKPIQVAASASFDAMMKSARLQPVADAIRPHFSPAVRMKTKPLKKAGWLLPPKPKAPALGGTRLGGWPDLPRDVAWPMWDGRPMAFLAQVNIAEARAAQPGLRLPSAGLLSFFLGCDEMTYEKDDDSRSRYMCNIMAGTEAGRDAWRVIYTPAEATLERRAYTATPLPQLFEPCAVQFVRGGQSMPGALTVAYERLPLDSAQRDDFNELVDLLEPAGDATLEQLMGHPMLIQGTPPEMMCELSSRGMNPWKYPAPDDPAYPGLAAAASEWGLLLQLTSNHEADFLWGDGGHFYFYGHRAAMEAGDFSTVWVNYEN
jgi:uncharacterized protein YwqG